MVNSPKFRRKRSIASGTPRADDTPAQIPPIHETAQDAARLRAEADARQITAATAKAEADEKARRKADFEEVARAEALRRVKAARAKRAAEARAHADQQEADRLLEAARQQDETRRAQAHAAKALRDAEEKRRIAEQEAAREAEDQRRAAQAEADKATRLAKARKDAEQRRAEAEISAAEARRLAASQTRPRADSAPLALTDMVPVAAPADPVLAPDATTDAQADAKQAKAAVQAAWGALDDLTVDKAHLERNRIITATRDNPAHGAFDVLRTRLLQVLAQNNWRRVAITSPGKECGKTFTTANLAISLSRQENCRTLVVDLDMRRPSMHKILGVSDPGSIGDVLRGIAPADAHLRRMGTNPVNAGRNIAFALNDRPEPYASELLQDPRSEEALRAIEDRYQPDVMLMDLPPALSCDDVIAARTLFDGVLLVVGGGMTTEKEITEVERRLGNEIPILGMILNRAEGTETSRYSY